MYTFTIVIPTKISGTSKKLKFDIMEQSMYLASIYRKKNKQYLNERCLFIFFYLDTTWIIFDIFYLRLDKC